MRRCKGDWTEVENGDNGWDVGWFKIKVFPTVLIWLLKSKDSRWKLTVPARQNGKGYLKHPETVCVDSTHSGIEPSLSPSPPIGEKNTEHQQGPRHTAAVLWKVLLLFANGMVVGMRAEGRKGRGLWRVQPPQWTLQGSPQWALRKTCPSCWIKLDEEGKPINEPQKVLVLFKVLVLWGKLKDSVNLPTVSSISSIWSIPSFHFE